MLKRPTSDVLWPVGGFALILAAALWVTAQSHGHILAHSPYDSYTLEALAWRDGHMALSKNYEWLELAVYQGKYWVSFPPVPAVPMLVLSFFFGADTPSGAATLVYFLGALGASYALLRRYLPADQATLWIVFAGLGGTALSLAVPGGIAIGGVWFQAQLLGMFLTALAFLLVDGKSKRGWAAGLTCLALAVGCRPFNVVFFPVLLWMLLGHLGGDRRALLRYLAGPAVVAIILGTYNAVRFGSPLEFGHKYLPELTRSGEGMFLPHLIPQHLRQVFTAPTFHDGVLSFPMGGGFAVYLTNPMLLIALAVILVALVRRTADITDALMFGTLVLLSLMLLSHRTNGGWQYGTRYLTDLLPAAVFVVARHKVRIPAAAAMAMGALIAFNLYAITVFEAPTK